MRALPILTAAAMALALSGCLGLGGKVPPTLFNLTPAHAVAAGTSASGKLSDAIIVLDPETDRRLGVQRVPVQIDDSNVAYLKSALWVERPARLMRALLAETLRAKGNRLVFEGVDTEASGRMRLYGRLVDMGYDARSQSVVVRFDAVRETPGGVVTTKRFENIVPWISDKPALVGPALNQAANAVADQVADWIG